MPPPYKKRLYMRALVLLVLLPMLNSFGLQFFYAYTVAGNIAFASAEPFLSSVIKFIGTSVVFCSLGLYLRAYYEFGFKGSAGMLVTCAVSALIPYAAAVVIVFATTVNPTADLPFMLLYSALSFAAYIVILATVAAVAAYTQKRAKKRGTCQNDLLFRNGCVWSAIIYAAAGLLQNAAETISDIAEYGAPTSANDYIHLISPYIALAIYSIAGMFIARAAGSFSKTADNNIKDPL